MGSKAKEGGGRGLSRRDFLKVSAAGAAMGTAGVGLDFALRPSLAGAAEVAHTYHTTCPYCSASCGQLVDVDASGNVLDIYGDARSPINWGGLCAKGAGAFQHVTNPRRIGAFTGTHPVNSVFAADTATSASGGIAYKRTGNGDWSPMALDTAMGEIATQLVAARGQLVSDRDLLAAGSTVDGILYHGFFGSEYTKNTTTGRYLVSASGCKSTHAAFEAAISGLSGQALAEATVAQFDSLVYEATNPADFTSYTFKGRSDIAAKLHTAAGVPIDSASVTYSSGQYVAFVSDYAGNLHRMTSGDGLTWTYGAAYGSGPGLVRPSVIVGTGGALDVWGNRPADVGGGVAAASIYHAHYDGSSWGGQTECTGLGLSTDFLSDPWVIAQGSGYKIYYCDNGHLASAVGSSATAFSSPAVFHTTAGHSENTICASPGDPAPWFIYSTFADNPTDPLAWAYGDMRAYVPKWALTHNSKGVAFLGCSHMNNEQNYTYRKIIAQFGSSNVEHQARI